MRTPPKLIVVVAIVAALASPRAQESTPEEAPHDEPPWQALFDGKTLDGWTQRGGKAKYAVEDGTIVGTTVPKTPNSFLCTEKPYADFELELEFMVDDELNSGIQIRSAARDDGRVFGYQVEIDPSDRAWSAGIYDEARRGWLNPLAEDSPARAAFRHNDWNHYRIVCIGDWLRTWINGEPAADLRDPMTSEGFIALQVHGVGKRGGPAPRAVARHPTARPGSASLDPDLRRCKARRLARDPRRHVAARRWRADRDQHRGREAPRDPAQ